MLLPQLALCSVFLILAGACLLSAFSMFRKTTKFLETAQAVTGIVVDRELGTKKVVRNKFRKSQRVRFLDVTFRDGAGVEHAVKRKAKLFPYLSEGSTVMVFFDPANPKGAQLGPFLWHEPLSLAAIGACFLLAGFGILFAK